MGADSDGQFGPSGTIHLTVDGESWEVIATGGQFDFKWISGVADGYGFTSRPSLVGATLSVEQLQEMIREFMNNVNPETGYLD